MSFPERETRGGVYSKREREVLTLKVDRNNKRKSRVSRLVSPMKFKPRGRYQRDDDGG